jgi:hypothetical protein
MHVREWSHSNLEYGRKLVSSGLQGARKAEQEFLHGKPLGPVLSDSACTALIPAAIGACVAALGCRSANGHRSATRAVAFSVLGSVVGFAAGMAWGTRRLTSSVAAGARTRVEAVRDEHWLEANPIDYA